MSLSLDLAAALTPFTGQIFQPAHPVQVSDGQGVTLTAAVLSVERLGISCESVQLDVPALAGAGLDRLKGWGQGLCQRVRYLLETLGPLEFDAQGPQVLIRSQPPDASQPGRTRYYEIQLSSQGQGRFVLQRMEFDRTTGQRQPVPLDVTFEQLSRLVNDLLATLPTP